MRKRLRKKLRGQRRAHIRPLGVSEGGLIVGYDPVDRVVFPLGTKVDGRRRIVGVPGKVKTHGMVCMRIGDGGGA